MLGAAVLEVTSLADVQLITTHSEGRPVNPIEKVTKDWLEQGPAINIVLPADFPKKFGKITEENIGHRVLMVLGDRILMAPVVRDKISTPSLQIALGGTNLDDARQIVSALRSMVRRTDPKPK